MAGNTFGQLFRITTFGESHGEAIGVIIDGCPAQLDVDLDYIQGELDKRKPGQSKITTQRKESDTVKILSGVFEGKTTGTPIAMLIPNEDQRSKDYGHNVDVFRLAFFGKDDVMFHKSHCRDAIFCVTEIHWAETQNIASLRRVFYACVNFSTGAASLFMISVCLRIDSAWISSSSFSVNSGLNFKALP